eukprot:3378347-Lingulodinium_polyedra.AAC.1
MAVAWQSHDGGRDQPRAVVARFRFAPHPRANERVLTTVDFNLVSLPEGGASTPVEPAAARAGGVSTP